MRTPTYELTRCIVCDSAESVELADADAMRREVEALWAFHGRRLRPSTPPQRLMDRVAFSEHPPLRVVECARCGFVFRNPIERAHELEEIYAAEAPTDDVLRALHETQRESYRAQARGLARVLSTDGGSARGAAGLEVGSYVGAFLAAARDEGLRFEGLDINPDVNAFTRALGFVVHDGALEDFHPGRAFDVVAIWNCFDQLPDPRAAARAAWRLLRPNGLLALRVPNGSVYARLHRHLAHRPMRHLARLALAHNNLLTFPYRYGFTPRSLTQLLARADFAVEQIVGDVLVPTADEYTRRWAALEERVVKSTLRLLARRNPGSAPWIEVYARRKG